MRVSLAPKKEPTEWMVIEKNMRKDYESAFKVKVVIESLKGDKTLAQVSNDLKNHNKNKLCDGKDIIYECMLFFVRNIIFCRDFRDPRSFLPLVINITNRNLGDILIRWVLV